MTLQARVLTGPALEARLDEVAALGAAILQGAVQGRVVVDVNA